MHCCKLSIVRGGHLNHFFFLTQPLCASAKALVVKVTAANVSAWCIHGGLICNCILIVVNCSLLRCLLFISRMTLQRLLRRLLLMSTQGDERQQVAIEAVWQICVQWACVSVREQLDTCDALQDGRWTPSNKDLWCSIAKVSKNTLNCPNGWWISDTINCVFV